MTSSCFVGELDVQQFGDQILTRVLLPPFDVFAEHLTGEVAILLDVHRLTGLVAQHGISVRTHRRLLGIRDAGEHADGLHRQFSPEVLDEIETPTADEGVETGSAEGTHLAFDRAHSLRCERARHDGAVDGVQWRILVDEDTGRDHRIGKHDLQDVAFG
jgi:hypothetical protein